MAFEDLLARTNVDLIYAHEKKGALQQQLEMRKFFAEREVKKCFIQKNNICRYKDGLFQDGKGYYRC
jgi:hypothetical protein